ncbi:RNase adapter RapZ [Rhodobacteraceae bacterium 63075]|nr:RNase adapter RapZ [Rhodobacteraceae bacterium 63075]
MDKNKKSLVFVTGPSGAGHSTAINALEDLGYEAIDNLPLSLVGRLLGGPPLERPLALGLDVRNRDFSARALLEVLGESAVSHGYSSELLYLDCRDDVLLRRFSETRRRHPLEPNGDPARGIAREHDLLAGVRARADVLIDTSELSPHELRAELGRFFMVGGAPILSVSVQSFSYKRGLPRGVDMVLDARFLRNPHWEAELRPLTGREPAVQAYVAEDARFSGFFEKVRDLALDLLPAYRDEGKAHFAIGFGCTGGRHRSVTLAERLAKALAEEGWQVSIRHRELERAEHARAQGTAPADTQGETDA